MPPKRHLGPALTSEQLSDELIEKAIGGLPDSAVDINSPEEQLKSFDDFFQKQFIQDEFPALKGNPTLDVIYRDDSAIAEGFNLKDYA